MQENILRLKESIKRLVALQIDAKAQRKKSYKGRRTLSLKNAAVEVTDGKNELRHHYLTYATLRGRDLKSVESYSKEPFSQIYINKLIAKYEAVVCDNKK